MKAIKLEAATKAEIIAAIKSEFGLSDVRDRIEREVFHRRVGSLLAAMDKACKEMDENRQSGTWDQSKRDRWAAANDRWNRINKQLSKLQGT